MQATRLILVDDHPVMREGLTQLLHGTAGFYVCGHATTCAEAMAAVAEHHPDVAVIDINLPDGNGIDLTRRLRESYPDLRILVLTAEDEILYSASLLRAGAHGYVMKGALSGEIIAALRTVADGGTYLSQAAREQIARRAQRPKTGAAAKLASLSARELQVLTELGAGLTTAAIADHLGISAKTVYSHLDHARQKLGLQSTPEVVRYAMLVKHDCG